MAPTEPVTAPARRRAAVLGSPIAHSLSPRLHRAAHTALGLTGWTYGRYEVTGDRLGAFLDGLGPDWAGLSLTMPLKRAVLPLLDEVSDLAATVGAVNTVLLHPDGRRTGDNTDVPGMNAVLAELGVPKGVSAALLGAGATAASTLAALHAHGADEVTVYGRDAARTAELRACGERLGLVVRTAPWDRASQGLRAPLVVSTTPRGATDRLAASVPSPPGVLLDVLYDPWPTALAAAWRSAGGVAAGGLGLLVRQAARQVELLTGCPTAPLDAMRAAAARALAAPADARPTAHGGRPHTGHGPAGTDGHQHSRKAGTR
ncbi:shikimate dehydrogenase [Streptomyces zhihengii]